MTSKDTLALERCISAGGLAIFPTDTLYGVGCSPESEAAVERMYRLKGRRPDKPSAVLFFSLDAALDALPELGRDTRLVLERLLPGPVTAVLPNAGGRFPLAGQAPGLGLGVRVPHMRGELAPLAETGVAILQTSANLAGGPDPRRIQDVPQVLRENVDLVIDGGTLTGLPSTVVDLTRYEEAGEWELLREGAISRGALAASIAASRAGR